MTTKATAAMVSETMTANPSGAKYSTDTIVHPNPGLRQVGGKNLRQVRSLLSWATKFATDLAWPVVPVLDKVPSTEHGHTDATTDVETLGELFAARKHNGFGVRCGGALRLVAVEIDERNHVKTGSTASLYRVAGVRMGEYKTPSYPTPNGSRMICYAPSDLDLEFGEIEIADGISAFGSGKQVVLPPSQHPSGAQYGPWYPGLDPWSVKVAPLPAAIVERIRAARPAATPRTVHTSDVAGAVDLELVKDALKSIDPWGFGYSRWIRVLMALHSEFPGEDGRAVAVAWACGKPGEVEAHWDRHFKSDGNRTGRVGIGTLFHEAKSAGWVRPATGPVGLPWSVTKADLDSCPACRTFYTGVLNDGSVVTGRNFCHNPKCQVKHKLKMGDALRGVLDYTGIRAETVPGMVWRQWRENANKSGRRYLKLPLPNGDKFVMVEVATPTPAAELQALLGVAAQVWEKKPKRQNVSHERRAKPAIDAPTVPPKPRAKLVERWIVSQPEQRRALQDCLSRLGVPFERRAYGGWRTAPLDTETRDMLHLELLTVPGLITLAPTTSISDSGTTCELDALCGGALPHNEAEVPGYAARNRVNVHATSPVKRSKRLSRAKRAADGKKRAALNAIERQSALRQLEV